MNIQLIKIKFLVVFFCLLLAAPVLAGMAQYTYDNLNRLIQVQYYNGTTITATINYYYDAMGNRTQKVTVVSP